MMMSADRNLTAIYCDDIRHEMGHKMSFMGCYQGVLSVHNAPVVLPKLCVYATAWTSQGNPFKTLTFRVVQDENIELARLDIPPEGLEQAAQVLDPTATRKTVSTAIVFSPLFIEKPTSIRLMAITDEGEIVGPRLLINVAQPLPQSEKPVLGPVPTAKVVKSKPAAKKKVAPVHQ